MKLVLAAAIVLLGCNVSKPKPESPLVKEGPEVPESCCCKTFPMTSDDGKPNYSMLNRMECSGQQGECVPDVQCRKAAEATP